MQNEIWLDVPGFPGYQVSNAGRVKSFRSGERILKQCNDSDGYPTVVLCGAIGKRTKTIHRLVALAFIPNPENKPEVDHINTNRMDNRVENLQWVTRKENANNPFSVQAYKRMMHIYSAVDKRKKSIIMNRKKFALLAAGVMLMASVYDKKLFDTGTSTVYAKKNNKTGFTTLGR